MTLAGIETGSLKSIEGGGITADVISGTALKGIRLKRPGPARIEPFTVAWGLPMEQVVCDWIAQTWNNVAAPIDGSITALDHQLNVASERRFVGARILETTIPAVDASSADSALVTVKFQPTSVASTKGSNAVPAGDVHKAGSRAWRKSNFRLDIDGLDCTTVMSVDSFTVKQSAAEQVTEFPNLRINLPEAAAQTWIDWHDSLVIRGNSSDERNGSLVFLSQNMTELRRIDFFNLGIFKIAPEKYEADSGTIRRVTAELYCERMELLTGNGTANRTSSGASRQAGGAWFRQPDAFREIPARASTRAMTIAGDVLGARPAAEAPSGGGATAGSAVKGGAAGGGAAGGGAAAGATAAREEASAPGGAATGGASGGAAGGGAAGGSQSSPPAAAAGGAPGAGSTGTVNSDPNAVARLGVANTFTSPQPVIAATGVGAIAGNGTSGSTAGVYGTSNSDTGYGGYFQNTNSSIGSKALVAVTATGTEALTVLASGRVGIGTAAPAGALDVKGQARVSGELRVEDLRVEDTARVGRNLDVAVNTKIGANLSVLGVATVGSLFTSGPLTTSGHLTKGSGAFKIDHPQDPSNKYLYHSFVESPDMMNIYNGTILLDDGGEAWVALPDWFDALNRDFRYQLTAIGAPGPNLYIATEIEHNRFRIAGGEPGMKVSWQVTGVRHDPYAKAHRIPVEEDKPVLERGSYLHPEFYGGLQVLERTCSPT
jgi:hypothetical protein